jgi:hypothetical protein
MKHFETPYGAFKNDRERRIAIVSGHRHATYAAAIKWPCFALMAYSPTADWAQFAKLLQLFG